MFRFAQHDRAYVRENTRETEIKIVAFICVIRVIRGQTDEN